MNIHSETYKRIREDIIRMWPAWKRKVYNSCLAVSAHAEKLPEDNYTMSTPVWTNYDRLISKTPEEIVAFLAELSESGFLDVQVCIPDSAWHKNCNETTCRECWLDWLKSPVDKESER